jgi:O-antigen ligase
MHTWYYRGAWAGAFTEKQSLGIASAVLASFSLNLFFQTGRKFLLVPIGLSVLTAIGSQSHGGIAMLAVGPAVSLGLWRVRATWFRRLVTSVPMLVIVTATGLIIVLLTSGRPTLTMFNEDLDINSRTFIWQHGLQFWSNAPILGTGLNAFWHMPDYYFVFLRKYGWMLDNFHNGYIETLVETGIIGYALLSAVSLRLMVSLERIAARRFECAAIGSFMVIFYVLNLSETFLLRSTNFVQVTFLFLLLKAARLAWQMEPNAFARSRLPGHFRIGRKPAFRGRS